MKTSTFVLLVPLLYVANVHAQGQGNRCGGAKKPVRCECANDEECATGLDCCPIDNECYNPQAQNGASDCTICPDGSNLCKDPHMKGLLGQSIDWFGIDGGWYSFVQDPDMDLNVNVRLTAPLPEEFPDRQLVTGLSVMAGGHSLVIEVTNPYDTDKAGGCPDGAPAPCLANGGLSVTVDGEKEADDSPLLHTIRDETLPGGIQVSAANLPVQCWQFGGDKIWARHYAETMEGRRHLLSETFEEWVLSFQHMAAHDWCTEYIAHKDLSDVQSAQAIFQIITPEVVVRLNVGIGHQTGGHVQMDGRVVPDLDVWEMDVGLAGLSLENESLTGILGETARPVLDKDGRTVMKGNKAYRGTPEDYRVSGALGTDFALLHQK
ncbi:unnamed protein product [Ectocarpus sp. 12 AP-2014]